MTVLTDAELTLLGLATHKIARIVAKMPPLLVVHGSADTEAPIEQARRYCRAVERAETPARGCSVKWRA